MLAIHNSQLGFHPGWVGHCEARGIPYRRVDCYASDLIQQLSGCTALMWHHGHSSPRDVLVARQILSALEHAGVKVFPDFRTAWHFDDKVAQKYMFEALDIPAVPAYVFVDKRQAIEWVDHQARFPKVFKLRRGAGSAGVRLARDRNEARKLVRRAFAGGFPLYNAWDNVLERLYKVRIGKAPVTEIAKGLARFFYQPRYAHILGPERGYVYFQDFVPGNDSDTRVIVIGSRAFGIRRLVRPGDFRASGSGRIAYAREDIDERCVEIAFECADKMGSSCAAFDFVVDEFGEPLVLEVSYGFVKEGYDACAGYWDRKLGWHPGEFDPQGWMVERVLAQIDGQSV